jgi:polyene glycosyltransferase
MNFTPALDAALTRGVRYVIHAGSHISNLYPDRLPRHYPAAHSGLPLAMTRQQRITNSTFKVLRVLALLNPRIVWTVGRYLRSRRAAGLTNAPSTQPAYAKEAAAVIGSTLFGVEYPFPAPDRLRMLGPMVPADRGRPAEYAELFDWLDAHDTVVYLGLSTSMRVTGPVLAAFVDAIAGLGRDRHVLWSVSPAQRALLPATMPSNLRIEPWVPQVEVLAHPHVQVFWTHGGSGGHQGLYFGKPLLVTPHSWETRDMAVRYHDSGAALMVEDLRSVCGPELIAKLDRLLTEDCFRLRAQYWRQRFLDAGGAAAAAHLVLTQR